MKWTGNFNAEIRDILDYILAFSHQTSDRTAGKI